MYTVYVLPRALQEIKHLSGHVRQRVKRIVDELAQNPDILHKARRAAFGKGYDDQLTRLRLAQGFGRLIRRASDRGVVVLLDSRAPSRLLSGLPAGVEVQRLNLAEAVAEVRSFLQLPGLADNRPHQ